MIEKEIQDAIVDVIDEFTAEEKTFTLYDVTKAARLKVGTQKQFLHNDVKDVIFDFVKSNFLDTNIYDVEQGRLCRIFKPIPYATPVSEKDDSTVAPAATTVPSNTVLTTPTVLRQVGSKLVSPTLDGRIVIGKYAVKNAKFRVGEHVFVNMHPQENNDELKRNLDNYDGTQKLKQGQVVMVDKKGNIRFKPSFAKARYNVAVAEYSDGTTSIRVS